MTATKTSSSRKQKTVILSSMCVAATEWWVGHDTVRQDQQSQPATCDVLAISVNVIAHAIWESCGLSIFSL